MNNHFKHLFLGMISAHLLLWASFYWQPFTFWIVFPCSLFILIGIAIFLTPVDMRTVTPFDYILAIGSGVGLYIIFVCGKFLIEWLNLPFLDQLTTLYTLVQPKEWWQFALLFLIVIPGEEIFWRGFVFQKLLNWLRPTFAIALSSVLYASAHIYAGTVLLLVAALVAGPVWAYLYYRTKNIAIVILSHLIFDLLLLVWLPLL
ncbi:CPBP family intramembrane glutamic endopeptidase [Alkalihalobacterium alkalinitrilicum]|uniref:CPBP family intramembrane glutamic endopeptidase n=1 Tax=Alkalihalobacterium alkalinitrilicum TaxID=427920 RepID=UPI000994BF43|nr:CPBP family intramembrane glutamic endopeptidase [Alkalihalobacterium alkalinitrilicum]